MVTDWAPGATDDRAALRAVFDGNGDGRLTSADAKFGDFKVLVTNADGTTSAKTLAQLGITEINLLPDTTKITLPDGSTITGQSSFVMAGTTRTAANVTLRTEAQGYRTVQSSSLDSSGARVIRTTGYLRPKSEYLLGKNANRNTRICARIQQFAKPANEKVFR